MRGADPPDNSSGRAKLSTSPGCAPAGTCTSRSRRPGTWTRSTLPARAFGGTVTCTKSSTAFCSSEAAGLSHPDHATAAHNAAEKRRVAAAWRSRVSRTPLPTTSAASGISCAINAAGNTAPSTPNSFRGVFILTAELPTSWAFIPCRPAQGRCAAGYHQIWRVFASSMMRYSAAVFHAFHGEIPEEMIHGPDVRARFL